MRNRLLTPQGITVLTLLAFLLICTAAFLPTHQQRIDVGGGNDEHLLRAFFAPEIADNGTTFRWSSPGSQILAAGSGPGSAIVSLRLNGDLRATLPDPSVLFERDMQPSARFAVTPGWRTYHILAQPGSQGFGFSADGLFRENRHLGVPVDSIVIAPLSSSPARLQDAFARAVALLLAMVGLAWLLLYSQHSPGTVLQRSATLWFAIRVNLILILVGMLLVMLAAADPPSLLRSIALDTLFMATALLLALSGLIRWVRGANQRELATPVQRSTYVGIFFVALATLLFQILLSRIFSVTMFYHFAFVAISIAMFGMTVGAGLVYSFPGLFPINRTSRLIAWSALAFAITMLLSFLTFLSIPFSLEAGQERSFVDYYAVVFTYLMISIPFIFSGICVTLTMTRYTIRVSQLYAADLAGAALGCVLVIGILQLMDGPTAVLVAASLAGLGAFFFSHQHGLGRTRMLALATTLLIAGFVVYNTMSAKDGQPGLLRLVWVRGTREEQSLYQKWNHFSRVKIYGDPESQQKPFSWGLSASYPSNRTFRQVYLQIDSEAGAVLAGYHGDSHDIDYLRYDVTNMAHYIRKNANVLVVGVGGGRDIISALAFDQKSVTGVEINSEIVNALNGPFGDLTGYLYRIPRVKFVVDEARSYIIRSPERYDILQISLIDTWAATTAGAYTFTENSLYTTQAWRIFLDRLAPGGVLTVSRWYFADRPGEVYRLTALATEALRERGISDPRQHIMVIRVAREEGAGPDGVGTILVSNEPFSAQDIATIEQQADQFGFDVMLSPNKAKDSIFVQIATTPDLKAFVSNYPINIAPPTDDNPFFFHMLRFGDIFDPEKRLAGEVSYNMQAVAILGFLLGLVSVLTVLFIIFPLLLTTRRGTLHGAGPLLLYFAGIGLGFMFIEISQMQRLVIFLGHPTYSLAVVLFTLLLSSGLGSFTTASITAVTLHRSGMQRLALLLSMLLIFGTLTPFIINYFESATILQRIAIAIAIIFPMGFCMGMAFPIGMKMAAGRVAELGPWLWGVNGAMSVCASVLAVAIALTASISATFWMGFACYVITFAAFLLGMRHPRNVQADLEPRLRHSISGTEGDTA